MTYDPLTTQLLELPVLHTSTGLPHGQRSTERGRSVNMDTRKRNKSKNDDTMVKEDEDKGGSSNSD